MLRSFLPDLEVLGIERVTVQRERVDAGGLGLELLGGHAFGAFSCSIIASAMEIAFLAMLLGFLYSHSPWEF